MSRIRKQVGTGSQVVFLIGLGIVLLNILLSNIPKRRDLKINPVRIEEIPYQQDSRKDLTRGLSEVSFTWSKQIKEFPRIIA